MKRSKLDNPIIKTQVVRRLATGETQSSIAKDVGLHRSQVSRFAKREDIQVFIEEEQRRLLEILPDAIENIKGLVREMPDIPKSDNKRRELSYKASADVLKSVGIFSSPTQSQTLVNIYQKNKTMYISPLVQKLLDERMERIKELANQKIDIEKDDIED